MRLPSSSTSVDIHQAPLTHNYIDNNEGWVHRPALSFPLSCFHLTSHLTPIETEMKKPSGYETFIGMLNEQDMEEYDRIRTGDYPRKVANQFVALMAFKGREELEMIRDWIGLRLDNLV